jgi:hypothetical protein
MVVAPMMVMVMMMVAPMMMVVMMMAPMMMVVMMVMTPMMMVVMVMKLRELHFSRLLLRPRGIIGLECLHGIWNRVQKFCVGTGTQRIDGACRRRGRFSGLDGQQRDAGTEEACNLRVHSILSALPGF